MPELGSLFEICNSLHTTVPVASLQCSALQLHYYFHKKSNELYVGRLEHFKACTKQNVIILLCSYIPQSKVLPDAAYNYK